MQGDLLEARRDQVRRHPVRFAILVFAAQGRSLDPKDLHHELPTHPAVAAVKYQLLVLQQAKLLS
jgi:hypothetical protein